MVMEEIKRQDEENDSASASESDFSAVSYKSLLVINVYRNHSLA